MKKVSVYFLDPGFEDYPFDDWEYRGAYHLIAKMLAEKGVSFWIVRGKDTYRGGNVFSGGWEYQAGNFVRREGETAFDVIFNKGRIAFTGNPVVINHPELDELCTDKWKTYELFSRLSPLTVLVRNGQELTAAFAQIPSDLIVAKPIDRQGGEGVIVGTREKVEAGIKKYPYLLQEFLDTTGGIPGICEGMHDCRLNTINGRIVSVFVRIPKEGSFLANVSQGGRKKLFAPEDLPPEAQKVFRQIDQAFTRFQPRIYSVDLGRTKSGEWKIIELNSQPGLSIDDYREHPSGKEFFEEIVEVLATAGKP